MLDIGEKWHDLHRESDLCDPSISRLRERALAARENVELVEGAKWGEELLVSGHNSDMHYRWHRFTWPVVPLDAA